MTLYPLKSSTLVGVVACYLAGSAAILGELLPDGRIRLDRMLPDAIVKAVLVRRVSYIVIICANEHFAIPYRYWHKCLCDTVVAYSPGCNQGQCEQRYDDSAVGN